MRALANRAQGFLVDGQTYSATDSNITPESVPTESGQGVFPLIYRIESAPFPSAKALRKLLFGNDFS